MPTALSFQDEAYLSIKQMILNFTLKPGEKIEKSRLQELLGFSNTPVREASIRLQREGLFNVIPQSGTYVAKINLKNLYQARFVRESVESLVFEKAASLITEKDIKELKKIVQLQIVYLGSNDYDPFFQLDEQFHEYFYQVTDNNFVWDWLQNVNTQLDRFSYLRLHILNMDWDSMMNEHKQLIVAAEQHDGEELKAIVTRHLHLLDKEIKSVQKLYPSYFD